MTTILHMAPTRYARAGSRILTGVTNVTPTSGGSSACAARRSWARHIAIGGLVRSVHVGRRVIQQTIAQLGELDEHGRLGARPGGAVELEEFSAYLNARRRAVCKQ